MTGCEADRKSRRSPPYELVLFDFDGTLADSFPWFLRVLTAVAERYRFRMPAPHEIEALRGMDADAIITRLGVARWKLPFIAAHLRALKAEHIGGIPLFPSAAALLRRLHGRGVGIAIVSSDTEANVRRTLGETAPLVSVFACGAPLSGKAGRFRKVLGATGVLRRDALAVGDELRDAAAAKAAGLAFAGVSWGYAAPAALAPHATAGMFRTMEDLEAALLPPADVSP